MVLADDLPRSLVDQPAFSPLLLGCQARLLQLYGRVQVSCCLVGGCCNVCVRVVYADSYCAGETLLSCISPSISPNIIMAQRLW
jgi:hypothetical protein